MTDELTAPTGRRRSGVPSPWERFGWIMAAIWLVFLTYPVLALLASDAAPGWVVTGWAALIAFVVIYVAGFVNGMSFGGGGLVVPPKPIQWVVFGALIICAGLTIPATGGSALSFVPFIMSFASYGLTRIAHWTTIAASITITAAVVFLTPDGATYLTVLAIIIM